MPGIKLVAEKQLSAHQEAQPLISLPSKNPALNRLPNAREKSNMEIDLALSLAGKCRTLTGNS